MFRDPRYLAPLGVLLGVILVSAVLAHEGPTRGDAAAPAVATVQATSTSAPEATPTPDGAAVDARRLEDLVKVRDALLAYRKQHGKFPITNKGAITTICRTTTDPGCVLTANAPTVPFADGDQSYWFSSDGARVVLAAPALTASDAGQCPATFPAALATTHVICLEFERPAQ